jgi:hypothetical protein
VCGCVCIYIYTHTPHYEDSDEKGIESVAGNTGQDIKWQIK